MMEEGRLLLSALVPDGKDWVDVFAALATPIIAALAALFAYRAYRLERRKRDDEIFDRRYEFYMKVRNYYLLNCDNFFYVSPGDREEIRPGIPLEQFSLSTEAYFLFGKDIAKKPSPLGSGCPGYGVGALAAARKFR